MSPRSAPSKQSPRVKTAAPQGLPPRPDLGSAPRIRVPALSERILPSGLRVVAVRRAGVPLVEVRMRVPFQGRARSHLAQSSVLTEAFFSGTGYHDAQSLAEAIQSLGGGLSAGGDADRLSIGGSALAPNLRGLLHLLAEVLTGNTYPAQEVAGERDRIAEEIAIARTTPSRLAGEAVSRRLFGEHPYGRDLPTVEEVQAVTPAALRRLHRERVSPTGAILVMVGDIAPKRAIDIAEAALADWQPEGRKSATLQAIPAFEPGGISLLDRRGSVQTSVRIVAPAPTRNDPDYAALALANTVFAGYFSSRLVANIREDKGYTYSPHSTISHSELASVLTVDADVATDVTAPALVEMWYEQARVATSAVTQDELDSARRYLIGTLALSTASQAGLAGTLVRLLDSGLEAAWLRDYPKRLGEVSVGEAYEAARRWLSPAASATVLVGDESVISDSVGAIGPLSPLVLD